LYVINFPDFTMDTNEMASYPQKNLVFNTLAWATL
jgi:hypothetical protein